MVYSQRLVDLLFYPKAKRKPQHKQPKLRPLNKTEAEAEGEGEGCNKLDCMSHFKSDQDTVIQTRGCCET